MKPSDETEKPEAPIEIVEYDTGWPARFDAEQVLLEAALRPWLAGPIEHIGSTAIPGMPAKPVIDIMAPVRSIGASRPAIPEVARLHYMYFPYRADIMHWFCKPSATFRTHHLHLVRLGSQRWNDCLAFRDAIRGNVDLANEYKALKKRLATDFKFDREAYTEGKSPFVQRVLSARAWELREKST